MALGTLARSVTGCRQVTCPTLTVLVVLGNVHKWLGPPSDPLTWIVAADPQPDPANYPPEVSDHLYRCEVNS